MQDFIQKILRNVKVDLTEEFDRNFERKSFFNRAPWLPTKRPVNRGSILVRSSGMRNSIRSQIRNESIVYTSSRPQTGIQNEGGEINRVSKKGKAYTIRIPERRFIGQSPEVDRIIRDASDHVISEELNNRIRNFFNNG